MFDLQHLFPSANGEEKRRKEFLSYLGSVLEKIDNLKDENKLSLGEIPIYSEDYYNQKINSASIPHKGLPMEETIDELIELLQGQRFLNSRYVMNATPLPSIASLLGNFVMTLINGNNIWDVDGSAGANAEVQVVSSLSKIVGYDETKSGGYTTWGGQGAVFNSLRLAIARRYPNSNKEGIPNNLYVFCSELAHFSLYKSAEATGIGTNHLIKIKSNLDDSMDIADLQEKMVQVINNGGIPIYVTATMGTTDSFGIDDISAIKQVLTAVESEYNLEPIFLHADSAMGGMYTFFNDYDFDINPLNFDAELVSILETYQQKFKYISLADSMVFDFHKLGQTPYITSLFLVKDKSIFKYVDIEPEETPYVGNRGYGSYHTSYTLECSRMGSALTIYASLKSLGIEGYQKILANYLVVNIAFREALKAEFPDVSITNNLSPVTTFRFYDNNLCWGVESSGEMSEKDIEATNDHNNMLSECFAKNRDSVYFGSTTKQRLVTSTDTNKQLPVFVHKFYSVSPYTTSTEIPIYIDFLRTHKNSVEKALIL
jgi:glutamate/tyrosine decarboxylase-like PLP-dependent enzyme